MYIIIGFVRAAQSVLAGAPAWAGESLKARGVAIKYSLLKTPDWLPNCRWSFHNV